MQYGNVTILKINQPSVILRLRKVNWAVTMMLGNLDAGLAN
jgi:hypothetical protein